MRHSYVPPSDNCTFSMTSLLSPMVLTLLEEEVFLCTFWPLMTHLANSVLLCIEQWRVSSSPTSKWSFSFPHTFLFSERNIFMSHNNQFILSRYLVLVSKLLVSWSFMFNCKHVTIHEDQLPLGISISALLMPYLLGWHRAWEPLPSPWHWPGTFNFPSLRVQDASSSSTPVQETSTITELMFPSSTFEPINSARAS